jgi:NAD-dependent dihydropyrimidine dehydrogenase PreA subunit
MNFMGAKIDYYSIFAFDIINQKNKVMAFKIDPEVCSACGACKDECPVDAIVSGDVYHIEEDTCIECGACESACPSNAIYD